MSAFYHKRLEAVFLCTHPNGPKLLYSPAAKKIKKVLALRPDVGPTVFEGWTRG